MQSSQVRNVGLPSSAEAKRDVPAWTQDPKIFPLDWFSVSRPNIIRQTKEYVSELSKWRNCPKIKTLSKLKAVLKRIMMFLHTHTSYIDGKSLLECDLEEDLITLVSLYMDMELRVLLIKKSALNGTSTSNGSGPDNNVGHGNGLESDIDTAKNDKLVSDRISYWLYTVLTGHDQRMDALLTTTVYTRHTRPVLDPIFRKILNEMPEGPLNNVNYVRHMLAYKTWRERVIVTEDTVSEELNTRILQQLVPREYAFPPSLLRCLGKGENARDHVRPHNVNLADACRNFMRVCREIPANAAEQINFGSIPLFDDDMLGDEENEVNKIMNMISSRKQTKTTPLSPRRSCSPEVDVFIDLTKPKYLSATCNRGVSSTIVSDVIDLTEEDEKPVIASLATLESASTSRLAPAVQRINTSKMSQPPQDCSYALAPSTAQVETRCFTAYRDQDIYLVNISCMCPVRAHRQRECQCQDKKIGYHKENRALKTALSERKYEKDATFVGRCFQFSIGNKYAYPSEDDVDSEMDPLVVGNSNDQVKLEIKSSAAVTCNTNNIDEERDDTTEFCDKLFTGSLNNCDCDGCKRREDNLTLYENRTCTSVESHVSADELSDINVRYKQKPLLTCTQRISHPSSVADMYAMEKTNPIILHSQPSTSFSKSDTVKYFSETLDKRKSFVNENNAINNKHNLLKSEVNLSDNSKTEIRKIKLPVIDKTDKNILPTENDDNFISSTNILQDEIIKCKQNISSLTNLATAVIKNTNIESQKSSSTNINVLADSTNITVESVINNKYAEQNKIPVVSISNDQSSTTLSVSDCTLQIVQTKSNFKNLELNCSESFNRESVKTDNIDNKDIQDSTFNITPNYVSEETVFTVSDNTLTQEVSVERNESMQDICPENFEQTRNMITMSNMNQSKNDKYNIPINNCDNHLNHTHFITNSNPEYSNIEKSTADSENLLLPIATYSSEISYPGSKFSDMRKRKTTLEIEKEDKIVTNMKNIQDKNCTLSSRKRRRRKSKINVYEIKQQEHKDERKVLEENVKINTTQNKVEKLTTDEIFLKETDFVPHNSNDTYQQNLFSTAYEKNAIEESKLVASDKIECDTTLQNSNIAIYVRNNSDDICNNLELVKSQKEMKNSTFILNVETDLTNMENSASTPSIVEYGSAEINTNATGYEDNYQINEITSEKSIIITPPESEATEMITSEELITLPTTEYKTTEIVTPKTLELLASHEIESEITEGITTEKSELIASPITECEQTGMVTSVTSDLLASSLIECEPTEIIISEKSELALSPVKECEGTEAIISEQSKLITSPITECEHTKTITCDTSELSPIIKCESTEMMNSEKSELSPPIIEYEGTEIIISEKSELIMSPITECEHTDTITSDQSEFPPAPVLECESTKMNIEKSVLFPLPLIECDPPEMITSDKSELFASPVIECETTEIIIPEKSEIITSHIVESEGSEIITSEKSELLTAPIMKSETSEKITSEKPELRTSPVIEHELTEIVISEKSELIECEPTEMITSHIIECENTEKSELITSKTSDIITSEKSEILTSPIIECATTEIITSPNVYKENYFNDDVNAEESFIMMSHTIECEAIEENACTIVYKENNCQEAKLTNPQTDKSELIQENVTYFKNEENVKDYVSSDTVHVSKEEITDYISNDNISDEKFVNKDISKEVINTVQPKHRRKQDLKEVSRKEKFVASFQSSNLSILEEEQEKCVKNKELYIVCKNLSENEIKYLRNNKQLDNSLSCTENQNSSQIKTKKKDTRNEDNVLNDKHKDEMNQSTKFIKDVEQHEKFKISQLTPVKNIKGHPSKIKLKRKTHFNSNDYKESLEDSLTNTTVSSDKKIKRSRGRPPKAVTNKFKFLTENFNLQNLNSKPTNITDNNILVNISKTQDFITQTSNEISEEDIPLVQRISLSLKRNKLKSIKLNSTKTELSEYEDNLPLTKRKGKAKYKSAKKYTSFNAQPVNSHENFQNEKNHLPSVTTIKGKSFRDKLNTFKFQPKNTSTPVDNFLCEKHEDTFSTRKSNSENKSKKAIKTYSNRKSYKAPELFSIPDVIKVPSVPSNKSKTLTFSDEITIIEIHNHDTDDDEENSIINERVKFIKGKLKSDLPELCYTINVNDNDCINRAKNIKIKKFRNISDNTMFVSNDNYITQDSSIKKTDIQCENKNEISCSTEYLVKNMTDKKGFENIISATNSNKLEEKLYEKLNSNESCSRKNKTEESYQTADKNKKLFDEFEKNHSNLNVLPKKLLSRKAREKLNNLQKKEILLNSIDMYENQDSEIKNDKITQDFNNLQELSNKGIKNEAKQISELLLSDGQKDQSLNHPTLIEQEKNIVISSKMGLESNLLNVDQDEFNKTTDNQISLNRNDNATKETSTDLLNSSESKKIVKQQFSKFKFKTKKNNLFKTKHSHKNLKDNKSSFRRINKKLSILNKNKRGRSRKSEQSFNKNRSFKKTKKFNGIKTITKNIETNNSENVFRTASPDYMDVKITKQTKEIDSVPHTEFLLNNVDKPKLEISVVPSFEIIKNVEQKLESAEIDNKSADMLYKPSNKIYEKQFDFYSDQDDVSNSELVIDTSAESSDAEDFNSGNKSQKNDTINSLQANIPSKPSKYHHRIAEIVNLNENVITETLEENSLDSCVSLSTKENKFIIINTALNEDKIESESRMPKEIINNDVDFLNSQSLHQNCNESTTFDDISKIIVPQTQQNINIYESSLISIAKESFIEHTEVQENIISEVQCTEHANLIEESEIKTKTDDLSINVLKTFCAEIIELSEDICDEFHSETLIKENVEGIIVSHNPSIELSMNIEIGFESCTLSQELLQEEHAKEGCVKCSVNGKHKDNRRVTIWKFPQDNIKEYVEECVALPEISYCQAVECLEPNVCILTAKVDSIKVSTDSPVLDNYNLCILADIAMNSVHLNTKTENNNVLDVTIEGTSKNHNQNKLQKDERCYYVTFTDKIPLTNKPINNVPIVNSNTEEISVMNVQKLAAGLNVKGTILENKIQALTERAKSGSKINGENLDELYKSLENICELEISTLTKNSSKSECQNIPLDATSTDAIAVNNKIHEPNITIDIPNTALLHLTPDDDDFLIKNEPFTLHSPTLVSSTENTHKKNTSLITLGEDKNIYNVIDSITKDQNITNSEDENIINNTKVIEKPRQKIKKSKSKGKSLNNFNSDASYMLNKYKSNQDSNKNVDINNQHTSNNKDKSTSPPSYIRSTRPMRMVTTRKRNVNVLDNSFSEEPAKKVSASEKMFDKLLEEHKKELSKGKQQNGTNKETSSNMNVENTSLVNEIIMPPTLDSTTNKTDSILTPKTETEEHNIPLSVLQYDSSDGHVENNVIKHIQQNISENQDEKQNIEKKENILNNQDEETMNNSEIHLKENLDINKSQVNEKDLLMRVDMLNEVKSEIQQPVILMTNETCQEFNMIQDENRKNTEPEMNIEKQIIEKVALHTNILSSETEELTEAVELKTYVLNVSEPNTEKEQISDDIVSNTIIKNVSEANIEIEKFTEKQITKDIIPETIVEKVCTPSIEIENTIEEQITQPVSNAMNEDDFKTHTDVENNTEEQITEEVVTNTAVRNVSAIEVVQDWFNRVDGDKSKINQYTEITYQTIEDCNFFEEVSNTSENERKVEDKVFSEHQTPDSGIAFDEDSVQKDKSVPENLSDNETCCPSAPTTTKNYFYTVKNAELEQPKTIVNLSVAQPITCNKSSNMKLKVSIPLERIKDILPLLGKHKLKKRKECILDVEKGKKRKYSLGELNLNPLTRVQDYKIKRKKHEHDTNIVQECSIEEVLSPVSSQKDISVRTKGSVKEYPDCLFGITESPVPSGSFHSPYPSDISLTEEPTFYEEGGIDLCNDYPCYDSFEVLQEQQSLQREYNVVDDNPKDVQQGLQAGYCVVDSQFLPLSEYMNDGDYILIDNKIFNDKRMVPVNMHQVQPETKPHNTEEVKRSEFDDSEKEDSLSETVEEIIKNPNLFSEQSNAEVQVITMDQATSEVQVVITSDTDMNETYLFGITLQNELTNDNTPATNLHETQHEPMDVQEKQTEINTVSESCDISTNKSENEMFRNSSEISANNVVEPICTEIITSNPIKTNAKNNKTMEQFDESKTTDMSKEIICDQIKEKKSQIFRPRSLSSSETEQINVSLEPLCSSTIKTYLKIKSPIPRPSTTLPSSLDTTKIIPKPCSSKIMKNEENINTEPKVYILKSSDKAISNSDLNQKKYDIQVKISEAKNLDKKLHASIQKSPLKKYDSSVALVTSPSSDLKSIESKAYQTKISNSKIAEDAFDKLKEEKTDILPPDNRTRYSNLSTLENVKNRNRKDMSLADHNRRYSFERDSPRTRLNTHSSSDTKRSYSAYTEPSPKPTYKLPPSDPTYRSSQYNYKKPNVKSIQPKAEQNTRSQTSSSHKDWLKNETLLNLIKTANTIYNKKY